MKVQWKKLIYICGFLGPATMILGSLVTAILYHGRRGESHSFLNHFISELGEVGVSTLAPVFNFSLIIGGLAILIFIFGLVSYIRTNLGYVATAFGFVSCISCSLVGFFPMNHLSIHTTFAYSFFYSGLVAVALFNLAIIFDKEKKVSRWFAVQGIITAASFASFLIIPHVARSAHVHRFGLHRLARPDIWLFAILEWSVFITVLSWVILMSIYLVSKGRMAKSIG